MVARNLVIRIFPIKIKSNKSQRHSGRFCRRCVDASRVYLGFSLFPFPSLACFLSISFNSFHFVRFVRFVYFSLNSRLAARLWPSPGIESCRPCSPLNGRLPYVVKTAARCLSHYHSASVRGIVIRLWNMGAKLECVLRTVCLYMVMRRPRRAIVGQIPFAVPWKIANTTERKRFFLPFLAFFTRAWWRIASPMILSRLKTWQNCLNLWLGENQSKKTTSRLSGWSVESTWRRTFDGFDDQWPIGHNTRCFSSSHAQAFLASPLPFPVSPSAIVTRQGVGTDSLLPTCILFYLPTALMVKKL